MWAQPDRLFGEAVKAAKASDVAIVFAGTSAAVESEGFDRADLRLPEGQDALIQAVAAANPHTVVVLSTGSAVLMDPWVDAVEGVVEGWLPGMEGGSAIAAILFGDVNPSGKLAETFPKRWEDCAAYGNFPGGAEVDYAEGIMVGYRHFDTAGISPLFPFGHGLSYTAFAYGAATVSGSLSQTDPLVKVAVPVTNTGKVEGAEVVQLYVHDVKSSVARPEKELKGFARLELKPGQTGTAEFTLDSGAFSFFDPVSHKWVLEPGAFQVLLGASSRDIRARADVTLEGPAN